MTPEERKTLNETLALAKENNQILKKIQRSGKWATVWRFTYWLIILSLSFGAYYFVQPYVDKLGEVYSGFSGDVGTVKNATGNFSDLLKKLGQ